MADIPKLEIDPGGWEILPVEDDHTMTGLFVRHDDNSLELRMLFATEIDAKNVRDHFLMDAIPHLETYPVRRLDGVVWHSNEALPEMAQTPWPHDVAYADDGHAALIDKLSDAVVANHPSLVSAVEHIGRQALEHFAGLTEREKEILAKRFGVDRAALEADLAATAPEPTAVLIEHGVAKELVAVLQYWSSFAKTLASFPRDPRDPVEGRADALAAVRYYGDHAEVLAFAVAQRGGIDPLNDDLMPGPEETRS